MAQSWSLTVDGAQDFHSLRIRCLGYYIGWIERVYDSFVEEPLVIIHAVDVFNLQPCILYVYFSIKLSGFGSIDVVVVHIQGCSSACPSRVTHRRARV